MLSCGLSVSTIFFPTLSHKSTIIEKKLLNTRIKCVLICLWTQNVCFDLQLNTKCVFWFVTEHKMCILICHWTQNVCVDLSLNTKCVFWFVPEHNVFWFVPEHNMCFDLSLNTKCVFWFVTENKMCILICSWTQNVCFDLSLDTKCVFWFPLQLCLKHFSF